ncbi:hypothetical protein QJS10_CPA01g00181 [Acorus calamus]|uniref:Uncharacterized protein n=1 Tax=Acorus calamus TaxID=4465 RepID=A0AAV9FKP6_ACOCL|nr:hypothetical protein QJS10_CPA01g00181 [Acorus calamus]
MEGSASAKKQIHRTGDIKGKRKIVSNCQSNIIKAKKRTIQENFNRTCEEHSENAKPQIFRHPRISRGVHSLSTTRISKVMFNPDLPEAADLSKWSIANDVQLKEITKSHNSATASSSQIKTATLSSNDETHDIQTVFQLYDASGKRQDIIYHVKASIEIAVSDKDIWYMSCNKCVRKTLQPHQATFYCDKCYSDNCVSTPRAYLHCGVRTPTLLQD